MREKLGLDFLNGGLTNMSMILIIGVTVTFLVAIFTAGYNDKPGTN
jgi:hypothetical protein